MTRLEPARLVRLYVLALGAGLLVEGGALLLVNALALPLAIGTNDTPHNLLHGVGGVGLLGIVAASRRNTVACAAVVFGVFYIALGVIGVLVDRPFGLLLGPGENVFHFTVGPLALLLGALALSRSS
jgi:hypothetical protein